MLAFGIVHGLHSAISVRLVSGTKQGGNHGIISLLITQLTLCFGWFQVNAIRKGEIGGTYTTVTALET